MPSDGIEPVHVRNCLFFKFRLKLTGNLVISKGLLVTRSTILKMLLVVLQEAERCWNIRATRAVCDWLIENFFLVSISTIQFRCTSRVSLDVAIRRKPESGSSPKICDWRLASLAKRPLKILPRIVFSDLGCSARGISP